MSRLDLEKDDIGAILTDLEAQFTALKSRQFAGASDIKFILNSTTAQYDSWSNGYADADTIDFTSDKMDYAFADLSFTVAMDSPTNIIKPGDADYPVLRIFQYPKANTGAQTDVSVNKRVTRFVTNATYVGGHTYYFKYYVLSTDSGSITVT